MAWLRGISSPRGVTLIELVTVAALVAVAGGIAMAHAARVIADARARGAARAFALRVREVRALAVQRSSSVGLQFEERAGVTRFQLYADGNGNGLRTDEIESGIDPPLDDGSTLADLGNGLAFGRDPAVPAVGEDAAGESDDEGEGGGGGAGEGGEDAGDEAGEAGVNVGSERRLTFTAEGTGSSGTIYLRGRPPPGWSGRGASGDEREVGGWQFAVRVYGPTGRVRLLEFSRESAQWVER